MSAVHRRVTTILKVLCGLQVVLILTQATLAGHMLSGNGAMLSVHEAVGTSLITWVGLGQVLAALLLWRPGRGPVWPIPTTIVLFVLVVLQLGWGFDGRLALHVPAGVTMLAVQIVLFVALGDRSPTATVVADPEEARP